MSRVLVDSSVWIEYFKSGKYAAAVEALIDKNHICINDIILAELCPSIIQKNERGLHKLLLSIENIRLDIDWQRIVTMQAHNLKSGLNKIGIPDLIIAQNAADNRLELYSADKHFFLMSALHRFRIYKPKD
jgi:predicted nucleic acid-binding protein